MGSLTGEKGGRECLAPRWLQEDTKHMQPVAYILELDTVSCAVVLAEPNSPCLQLYAHLCLCPQHHRTTSH